MNKSILGIICIFILFIFVSGCTITTNQSAAPSSNSKTFSGEGISFNYPENWNTNATGLSALIVSVKDPSETIDNQSTTKVYITKSDITYENPQDALDDEKRTLKNCTIISEENKTINGAKAYQFIATMENEYGVEKGSVTKYLYIAIQNMEENGKYYIIECKAPEKDFDTKKPGFEMIINSFKT